MIQNITPQSRMLATYHIGSDSYAMVVLMVINDKTILLGNIGFEYDLDKNKVITVNGIEYYTGDISKYWPTYPSFALPQGLPADEVENEIQCYTYDVTRRFKMMTYTLRKDGRWRATGEHVGSVILGKARPYRDPNF